MRGPWRTFYPTIFGERRRMPARLAGGALTMLALAASATDACAAANAAKGEIIARRWCAACHVVAADQTSANSDAPTFASIAQRHERAKKLEAFLMDPHPKMPDMNLSRSEIADIVAYIGSLGRR
jgi:mono/diheme cytochrome c family protein